MEAAGRVGDTRFPVDRDLLGRVRAVLATRSGLRFVVGGAGTGKSSVCAEIGRTRGLEVLDMDARMYGSWFGRFDPGRHPASHAWSAAPDPLAWQLALDPDAFAAFHAATTAEALDLLAEDLERDDSLAGDPARPILVDGGFGRPIVLAEVVPPAHVVCLALPERLQGDVWTASPERRAFLDAVAAAPIAGDPVASFLALDRRLHAVMAGDARTAGIPLLERDETTDVADLAAQVLRSLGIGAGPPTHQGSAAPPRR